MCEKTFTAAVKAQSPPASWVSTLTFSPCHSHHQMGRLDRLFIWTPYAVCSPRQDWVREKWTAVCYNINLCLQKSDSTVYLMTLSNTRPPVSWGGLKEGEFILPKCHSSYCVCCSLTLFWIFYFFFKSTKCKICIKTLGGLKSNWHIECVSIFLLLSSSARVKCP